jgi:hypothetical protein
MVENNCLETNGLDKEGWGRGAISSTLAEPLHFIILNYWHGLRSMGEQQLTYTQCPLQLYISMLLFQQILLNVLVDFRLSSNIVCVANSIADSSLFLYVCLLQPVLGIVHCPKRLVNIVADNYGRRALAMNNENFLY